MNRLLAIADRVAAGSGYDQALRTDIVAALGLQRNWGPLLVSVEAVEDIRLDRCPSSHLECWVFRDFTCCTVHIDGQKPAMAKAPTEPAPGSPRCSGLLREGWMVEAIEAAARALHQIECEISGVPVRWEDISPDSQATLRIQAKAAIDAYEAAKFPISPMEQLVEAMHQLLDDMGHEGKSVCGLAKAQAIAAYQPWRQQDDDSFMSLAEAERIIDECDYKRTDRPLPDPPKAASAIAALPLEEM